MMVRVLSVAAASFVSLALSSVAIAAPSADEAAILKIEHDMASSQTVEGVIGTWDKDVVWYDLAPGEVVGIDAVRKDFVEQFSHVTNIRTTILRIEVKADDKIGFSYSTQHLLADSKSGGPPVEVVFRETDAFQKKGGKWTLVHQQISLPVNLGTGMAVMDSK